MASIIKPRCQELACLGAAMLAGVGAGVFPGLDEASRSVVREEARYEPEAELSAAYRGWTAGGDSAGAG